MSCLNTSVSFLRLCYHTALIGRLGKHLKLLIDPKEVRLLPRPTDPYLWQYLPERGHLFTKQLSKHNIGAFREICRELGSSIIVFARDNSNEAWTNEENSAFNEEITGDNSNVRTCPVVSYQNGRKRQSSEADFLQESPSFIQRIKGLELRNEELRSQLGAAESLANERTLVIEQMQIENASLARHIGQLQATLQHRNTEALQRTRLVDAYEIKVQTLEVCLQDWGTRLKALQEGFTKASTECTLIERVKKGPTECYEKLF